MSADKMFEELGYKKVYENDVEILYQHKSRILGDDFEFELLFCKIPKMFFHRGIERHVSMGIEVELLKAINKKVEELGW